MALPGFNTEKSLYKTNLHYCLVGALVQADGLMLQQLPIAIQRAVDHAIST